MGLPMEEEVGRGTDKACSTGTCGVGQQCLWARPPLWVRVLGLGDNLPPHLNGDSG